MKNLSILITLLSLANFSCSNPELATVSNVEVERYMGTWFEIASFPSSFQKGCTCSKADYELSDDKSYVKVINSCIKKGKQGAVLGKAFVVEGSGNAKLKVQFFWPFKADYYIIALADDYSYAMVGHPNRDYLWILSRTKIMDENIFNQLKARATELGFDTSKLNRTTQDCE
jgi:apolipoprotein D and lipocalin family protein